MKRFQILFLLCLALSFTFSIFAQDTKEVIILQTSDVHSRIEPINQKGDRYYNKGGFVRRAAFLEEFRKDHKNVLLFDCGDISQGTPYYNMFRGEVEIKLMNEMGYDAMTIGNHEFDFDVDNMARIFKMADFSGNTRSSTPFALASSITSRQRFFASSLFSNPIFSSVTPTLSIAAASCLFFFIIFLYSIFISAFFQPLSLPF